MVVLVEYDRSDRVCIRMTGNRPSHTVAQGGGQFFYRGSGPLPHPAGAGAGCEAWKRRVRDRQLDNRKIKYFQPLSLSKHRGRISHTFLLIHHGKFVCWYVCMCVWA